ncbi:hypothetical protein Gpo141_00010408 [Globisporangium polare]
MTTTTAPPAHSPPPSPPSAPRAVPGSTSLSSTVVDVTGETTQADEPPRPTRVSVRAFQKKKKGGDPTETPSAIGPAAAGAPAKKKARLVFLESPVKKKPSAMVRINRTPAASAGTELVPFNVGAFLTAFSGDASRPPPPVAAFDAPAPADATPVPDVAVPPPSLQTEVAHVEGEAELLKARLELLERELGSHRAADAPAREPPVTRPIAVDSGSAREGNGFLGAFARSPFAPAFVTHLNSSGGFPPVEVRHLSAASFSEPTRKVKGEFYSSQLHQLVAARLSPKLCTPESKLRSSLSFLLEIRDSDHIKFDCRPSLLQALLSGRLGVRGASVVMFTEMNSQQRLAIGSSNANFNADFGSCITMAPCAERCGTHGDLLAALHGLRMYAHEYLHDYMRGLVARFPAFVSRD